MELSGPKYIIFFYISRSGEDLITLFNTPAIQQYLNGIPARETQSEKHIYQPGTLRKVLYIILYILCFLWCSKCVDLDSA